MKTCQNPSLRIFSAEISTRHFGRRVATAARDRVGRISCYLVAVDPDLFARKLGQATLVSVVDGKRCFEIARIGGTYRVQSAQHGLLLQGSESLSGRAGQNPDCFKVWCNRNAVMEVPLPRSGLLRPEQSLTDIIFIARAFSSALQHLDYQMTSADLPSAAPLHAKAPPGITERLPRQPLLIVPETARAPHEGFSKAMVLLQ